MIGSINLLFILALAALIPAALAVAGVIFLIVRYTPVISQNFEKQPLFMPLSVTPLSDGERVRFPTEDGLSLAGTYLSARSGRRAGVLVYCHEFLSNRFSYHPYLDSLRDNGYDIFTFDFRNHGDSEQEPGYSPMQWTSDREVKDLRAALEYLRGRKDHDPAGFGLFGVSRGGTTALVAASLEPSVWGVITDGAFPTRGTMVTYIVRWAEIYVHNHFLLSLIPRPVFDLLAWFGRRWSERRHHCRFPAAEAAVARLAPRPWLMIHGERDTYIGPDIARRFFESGNGPKEFWLVPGAKHNRCRERDPEAYLGRLELYLARFAPRRPQSKNTRAGAVVVSEHGMHADRFADQFAPVELRGEVVSPITG